MSSVILLSPVPSLPEEDFAAFVILSRGEICFYILLNAYRVNSANRKIGVGRFPNTFRFCCRGGIDASRVHGAFSPNGAKNRDVSPPGGMNASPTVFFATFPKQPDKQQFVEWLSEADKHILLYYRSLPVNNGISPALAVSGPMEGRRNLIHKKWNS